MSKTAYVNPAWRWHHGDNQEIDPAATRGYPDRWFGLPKPPPVVWDATLRLSERFAHLRDQAWCVYLGIPTPGGVIPAGYDAKGWPHLFAFHVFTAAWLVLPEDDQAVLLDLWEQVNVMPGLALDGAA